MALPQKRRVNNVLVSLIILVVVLAGSTGVLYYQNQNYASSHSRTDAEYNSYVSSHSYDNAQYSSLNSIYNEYVATHSHSNMEYEVLNYTSALGSSETLLYDAWSGNQAPNSYTSWNFSLLYAGYVWVNISAANRTNTYIEVSYTADVFPHGSYAFTQTVLVDDYGGWAVFPVLPCTNLQIRVGNKNQVDGTSMSVRANYYY